MPKCFKKEPPTETYLVGLRVQLAGASPYPDCRRGASECSCVVVGGRSARVNDRGADDPRAKEDQ